MVSISEAFAAILSFVTTWVSLPGSVYSTFFALLWLYNELSWAYQWYISLRCTYILDGKLLTTVLELGLTGNSSAAGQSHKLRGR